MASAAPTLPSARAAFLDALSSYGNPSSPHAEGLAAKNVLESARGRIARLAGVKSSAVIFTASATEANALAIQGRIQAAVAAGTPLCNLHILYLPTMHSSVRKTLAHYASLGVAAEPLALVDGAVDIAALKHQLRPETVLVAVDAVCGETGARFDTLRMYRAIEAAGFLTTAALFVDASQLPLVESIERTRLGASLMTLDAQKVGGVRGVGALIAPHHTLVKPIMYGGEQESGLRPGTEATAGIAAFACALEERAASAKSFALSATRMRDQLISTITAGIPAALVNHGKENAPHILNFSFPGIDTDYAVMLLDAEGFAVSTRSACETDSEDGSTTVRLLTGDIARAQSTLRISWGPETRASELMRFSKALIRTIRFLSAP